MDLTPLLNMLPQPWNVVAIFALGILAKILHGRLTQPVPEPSPQPKLDALLAYLRAMLGGKAPTPTAGGDIDHETASQIIATLVPPADAKK